jgi:hypothetical protein
MTLQLNTVPTQIVRWFIEWHNEAVKAQEDKYRKVRH